MIRCWIESSHVNQNSTYWTMVPTKSSLRLQLQSQILLIHHHMTSIPCVFIGLCKNIYKIYNWKWRLDDRCEQIKRIMFLDIYLQFSCSDSKTIQFVFMQTLETQFWYHIINLKWCWSRPTFVLFFWRQHCKA